MQGTKNLTQGPINRQLFTLAMPIMATSFIQMAYSLTDMAWVGRLGSESMAAVGAVGILTWMSGSIAMNNWLFWTARNVLKCTDIEQFVKT